MLKAVVDLKIWCVVRLAPLLKWDPQELNQAPCAISLGVFWLLRGIGIGGELQFGFETGKPICINPRIEKIPNNNG